MRSRGIFPTNDADFNNYIVLVVAYLIVPANVTRFAIAAGNVTLLNNLFTKWKSVYGLFANPATCTASITLQKNGLIDDLEKLLRSIYNDIPKSALTADDRTTLNLHERDTKHTAVGKEDHSPKTTVDHNEHLLITLRIVDPANPLTRAMPDGQKVMLEMYIGEKGLTEPNIPFANGRIVGRFLKEVDFIATDVGKTVYFRACYINTRGEQGPWSEVISDVIR